MMNKQKILKSISLALLLILIATISVSCNSNDNSNFNMKKPVIYLYPEKQTDISITLEINGDLTYTYPKYGNGWNVTAYPDGNIINKATARNTHIYFGRAKLISTLIFQKDL